MRHTPDTLAQHTSNEQNKLSCGVHRRDFLRNAVAAGFGTAALSSSILSSSAQAQTAKNSNIAPGNKAVHEIHQLRGDVMVDGKRITAADAVLPGSTVITGNDGFITFVIGNDSFFLRERSQLQIRPASATKSLVGTLRLITGALGSVWGKRERRTIETATATIGIRGTGVYVEARGDGVYACTCYGETELISVQDPRDKEVIVAGNHVPRWITRDVSDGMRFKPAPFDTHTNQEMDILEKCVGRRAPWFRPKT